MDLKMLLLQELTLICPQAAADNLLFQSADGAEQGSTLTPIRRL